MNPPTITLDLTERTPRRLARTALPDGVGELLWRRYSHVVAVDFPSPKTADCWQLTSLGWVGLLPLLPDFAIVLRPRLPLRQLWSMLSYAFDFDQLHIGDRLVRVTTLPDLYERLAVILAERVLARCRRGLYRAYLPRTERLTVVRGRIEPAVNLRTPWEPALVCQHAVQTVDVEENQLLAWTLERILRGAVCSPAARPLVQRAFRTLAATVTVRPLPAAACRDRTYDRLNADYRPLHALCAFFLEQLTPQPEAGDQVSVPFVLPMARLYERFVAAWLQRHLDSAWQLNAQERYLLDDQGHFSFTIDLVVRERATGEVRWVLDTKYRAPGHRPSADEIAQILAYAQATGAPEAVLIFPGEVEHPLDLRVGGVWVRSLTFALDGDLEEAGKAFVAALQGRDGFPARA